MDTESATTLDLIDGTAYGVYKFTFDSNSPSKTLIVITDSDATKDNYEFFGGIFDNANNMNDLTTIVENWTVGKSNTSATFIWTAPEGTEGAKLVINGIDNANNTSSDLISLVEPLKKVLIMGFMAMK